MIDRRFTVRCLSWIGCLCIGLLCWTDSSGAMEPPIGWSRQPIHSEFLTEGSTVADVDQDGILDLVAVPKWYKGPDFQTSREIVPAVVVPQDRYSDHFFSHCFDLNGDSWPDVLGIGFPGKAAYGYLNPGAERLKDGATWQRVVIADEVSQESPWLIDLIPGALPELVCSRNGAYGYYQAGQDVMKPWAWHSVSTNDVSPGPFGHGLGVADFDGDGRLDIIGPRDWWQQPAEVSNDALWTRARWAQESYGPGGAQIHGVDLDQDGDLDIVTSHSAHGYGLSWFERVSEDRLIQHGLTGDSSVDNPYGVVFSQLHAVELADLDRDGRTDIVTGKRPFAHNGHDPGGLQAKQLVWFRNVVGEDGVEFIPYLSDDHSGVGVGITVADVNQDGMLDIVSSNKLGLTVLQQTQSPSALDLANLPERWQVEKRPDADYVNGYEPSDAAKNMQVPPGFQVDLIASEPDLVQPISMCFDHRGRLWVIEGLTYPQKAPIGQGKDRIIILSDEDVDGSFETRKVFAEELNLASGIEVGFGGVWVGAAPELLFYPDADADDVPDGPPTVLLDGWGYQDTHETLNAFTWGPDGWLYGCHGVFTHSKVGKPGTPETDRIPINAGVWRYHPTRHEFEVFAHGTSNPWGVDFDQNGECFVTACVIQHLFHLVPGGRYFRQAGQHFDPRTYEDIATIADHVHYGNGRLESGRNGQVDRQLVAQSANTTSMVGGGHAHCGLVIYQADEFPPQYRGDFLFHNLHGHRIVRDRIETDGSSFVGRHAPDFALSHDHQQIGVGMRQGLDGAIYTSDWHDPQTCHNNKVEIWDRTNGRLFRIHHGDFKPYQPDAPDISDLELVERLNDPNVVRVRMAQRLLQERATGPTSQANGLSTEAIERLRNLVGYESSGSQVRLHAFWTRWRIGDLSTQELVGFLNDEQTAVRAWAVRLLGESSNELQSDALNTLAELTRDEVHPVVRREIASLLQRIPNDQRWQLLPGLLARRMDQDDRNLPFLIWYGAAPLADTEPQRLLEMVQRHGDARLNRNVIRRLSEDQQGRDLLVKQLKSPSGNQLIREIVEQMLKSVRERGGATMPQGWMDVTESLQASSDDAIQRSATELALMFGDQTVLPRFRQMARDPKLSSRQRIEALEALRQAGDASLGECLSDCLNEPLLAETSIRLFAMVNRDDVADQLLKRYSQWTDKEKAAVWNTLSSRRNWIGPFIAAMETQAIDSKTVPAYIVRQIQSLADESQLSRLEKVWGKISRESSVSPQTLQKYHQLLKPDAISRADVQLGQKLYETNCGKCHKLFEIGESIGPDLTGANRRDIGYWLENILDPNAVIGQAYQVTTFLTNSGRVIHGLVQSSNEDAVSVRAVDNVEVIRRADIEMEKQSDVSLMPSGQLEPMSDTDVLALFKFLMRESSQGSNPSSLLQVGDVEGESSVLRPMVTAGNLDIQPMAGFGDQWSSGKQLWWTGAHPSAKLTLQLPSEQKSTRCDITVNLTMAHDYARVSLAIGDRVVEGVDLYSKRVELAPAVVLEDVNVSGGKLPPLIITIEGANDAATKRFMVGIDSILIRPSRSK